MKCDIKRPLKQLEHIKSAYSNSSKACQTQRLFFEWHFAHFDGSGIYVTNFANFRNILPIFPPTNLYVIGHCTIDDKCQDHDQEPYVEHGTYGIEGMVH